MYRGRIKVYIMYFKLFAIDKSNTWFWLQVIDQICKFLNSKYIEQDVLKQDENDFDL